MFCTLLSRACQNLKTPASLSPLNPCDSGTPHKGAKAKMRSGVPWNLNSDGWKRKLTDTLNSSFGLPPPLHQQERSVQLTKRIYPPLSTCWHLHGKFCPKATTQRQSQTVGAGAFHFLSQIRGSCFGFHMPRHFDFTAPHIHAGWRLRESGRF
jgi:hypothetical protein